MGTCERNHHCTHVWEHSKTVGREGGKAWGRQEGEQQGVEWGGSKAGAGL